jgi:hypothetical protein
MTEPRDAIVRGHERDDRARAGGGDRRRRAGRNRPLVFARFERPTDFADDASGIGAEAEVACDFGGREQVTGAGDRTIDRHRAGDGPVRADAVAAGGALRERCDGVRTRVLLGPRVFDGFPAAAAHLFSQEPRHLDRIRDDEAASVGGHEQVARARLAATVDAVRAAARQPREVRLRGEQDPAEIALARESGEAVGFVVEFGHIPGCRSFPVNSLSRCIHVHDLHHGEHDEHDEHEEHPGVAQGFSPARQP